MAKLGTYEKELLPYHLQRQVRKEDDLGILESQRFEERAALVDAFKRQDEDFFKRHAWQKVRRIYPDRAKTPKERKELHDLADTFLKELKLVASQGVSGGEKALTSAARRGALYKPGQAQLPKEQRKAIEGNRFYQYSDNQVKNIAVERGLVDESNILAFAKTSPSKMYTDPNLSPQLRDRLIHEKQRMRYGIPKDMHTASEAKGPDIPLIGMSFAELLKTGFVSGLIDVLDMGVRAQGAAHSTWAKELREDPRLYDLREKYAEGPKYMGLPTEIAKPVGGDIISSLIPGPGTSRFETVEMLMKAPEDVSRIMGAQFRAAVAAAAEAYEAAADPWSTGQSPTDLVQLYGDTKAAYKMEALGMAEKQFPGDSLEQRQKRVDVIYDELIKHDMGRHEFENPIAGQLAHAILLDPVFGPLGQGTKAIQGLWNMGKWGAKTIGLDKLYTSTMNPITEKARYLFAQSPFDELETWKLGEAALDKMGEFGGAMKRALFGAKDAGEGAKRQIVQAGKKVDLLLSAVWGKDKEVVYDAIELFHRTDSGAAAHKFLQEAFPGDPHKVKNFMTIIRKVRAQSDKVYEISAARGQLNDVITMASGQKVARTASYIDGYVPHMHYEGVGNLDEAVRRVGYSDIAEAASAGRLRGYQRALRETDDPAEIAQLERTIAGLSGRLGAKADLINKMDKAERKLLYMLGEQDGLIDALGAGRGHRVGITTDAAKARLGTVLKPMKDARLQFEDYFKQQAAAAGRAEEIAELIKYSDESEVVRNLTNGSMVKVLPLSAKAGEDWSTKSSKMAMPISDELGMEFVPLDKEMSETFLTAMAGRTAASGGAASGSMVGAKVISNKVVMVPKAMAHRLQETLPAVTGSFDKAADGAAGFYDWFVRPTNHVWRNTKTVTRSLAFHATNIAGGQGLGILAHGLRAMNPIAFRDGAVKAGLGGGAFRLALSSAFADVMPSVPHSLRGTRAGGAVQHGLEATGDWFKNTKLAKHFSPENMDWRLPSGEVVKLAYMQELMSKFGIMGQAGLRYGSDLSLGAFPPGALKFTPLSAPALLARFSQKTAEVTRMQQVAAFGDDLQHAIAFMGQLKSTKIDDIHRAVDFTAEYAGNYSRLTKFEKKNMRDTFAFYSWMRYIYPHIARQMGKNPKTLAAIYKGSQSIAAYHEAQGAPAIPQQGMPDYAQMGLSFPLGPEYQPPGAYDEYPHEVAVGMMELPFSSFGGLAPGFHGESPLVTQLGPLGLMASSLLNGFDASTSRPYSSGETFGLPSFDEIEGNFETVDDMILAAGRVRDSRLGTHLVDVIPFGEAFLNLAQLYSRNGMHDHATEMWLRYRVGRDWLGIDNLMARQAGYEPMSRGLTWPGFRTYLVNPTQVAARRKARALELMPRPMVTE